MEKEQAILSIVSRMVTEGQRPWAFLVAVERNGRAHFMDVSRSGYYIPNASVIFITSHVQTYGHINDFLEEMGMRHGMTEWFAMEVQRLDEAFVGERDLNDRLRLALRQANNKIADLELSVFQLQRQNESLLEELENIDNTRYEKSEY